MATISFPDSSTITTEHLLGFVIYSEEFSSKFRFPPTLVSPKSRNHLQAMPAPYSDSFTAASPRVSAPNFIGYFYSPDRSSKASELLSIILCFSLVGFLLICVANDGFICGTDTYIVSVLLIFHRVSFPRCHRDTLKKNTHTTEDVYVFFVALYLKYFSCLLY
ncbi:hypothetical protein GWI33_000042 [Rhynchophorus ferrugineus]|uniref:Uncharacterized protein n=1 Tax=Rhynchophorus ferrugineus TaxID=354439 RepID=A0A834J3R4_RHYFE|nr:hypothetical protein GWI33_000042 [Rhynchophorus ferrugineus]